MYVGNKLLLTSQLAFPDSINAAVYAKSPYLKHGRNTSVARNAADMVFNETSTVLAHALFHVVPNAATSGYTAAYIIGLPV